MLQGLLPSLRVLPAVAGAPVQPLVAGGGDAAATQAAASTTDQKKKAAAKPAGMDLKSALEALLQEFGDDHQSPIIAADGAVYMERTSPDVVDGKLVLHYDKVGRVDLTTKRFFIDQPFLAAQEARPAADAKPTEVDGKYYWQSYVQADDGSLSSSLTPMSDDEVASAQQQAQAQQAKTDLDTYNQSNVDWIEKLGSISGWMKTIGFTGTLVDQMMNGPDPVTGRNSAHWLTGWMILEMIDAQAGGKLLPHQLKEGWVGTAMEWALQGIFFLQSPRDLAILAERFPRTAAILHSFTTPTRMAVDGVKRLVGAASTKVPGAAVPVEKGAAKAAAAVSAGEGNTDLARMMGIDVPTKAQMSPEQANAFKNASSELAAKLRSNEMGVVGRTASTMGKVAVVDAAGAVHLIDSDLVREAGRMSESAAKFEDAVTKGPATVGAMRASDGLDKFFNGSLGMVRPALSGLKIFGGLLGAAAGGLNVALTVKNEGPLSLVTEKEGRGAMFGFLGGAAFLGLMALPAVWTLIPEATIVMSAMNLATNIFYGVSMLNEAGLFGGGGFLDHDAVRAAFLIPPLSPLGLAGLWLKRREKAAETKAEEQQAAAQTAVQQVQALRSDDASSLQQQGGIQGAVPMQDGSLLVPTTISNDLSGSASNQHSSAFSQMIQSLGRPIEFMTGRSR